MIEFLPESEGAVVGLRVGGKLTDADYKNVLVPRLESLIAEHGAVRLLCVMDESFEGWDLQAAWDDASLGLRHRGDFEKLAIVGGPGWVATGAKLAAFLVKGEIRIFPADQLAAAWEWLRA